MHTTLNTRVGIVTNTSVAEIQVYKRASRSAFNAPQSGRIARDALGEIGTSQREDMRGPSQCSVQHNPIHHHHHHPRPNHGTCSFDPSSARTHASLCIAIGRRAWACLDLRGSGHGMGSSGGGWRVGGFAVGFLDVVL